MLVELPSHSNSISCSVANWGSYYTSNKFIFLSASVLKYMFDWFFLQPCLLVWLIGLQFVIDIGTWLRKFTQLQVMQVTQPGYYGGQYFSFDICQMSRDTGVWGWECL